MPRARSVACTARVCPGAVNTLTDTPGGLGCVRAADAIGATHAPTATTIIALRRHPIGSRKADATGAVQRHRPQIPQVVASTGRYEHRWLHSNASSTNSQRGPDA